MRINHTILRGVAHAPPRVRAALARPRLTSARRSGLPSTTCLQPPRPKPPALRDCPIAQIRGKWSPYHTVSIGCPSLWLAISAHSRHQSGVHCQLHTTEEWETVGHDLQSSVVTSSHDVTRSNSISTAHKTIAITIQYLESVSDLLLLYPISSSVSASFIFLAIRDENSGKSVPFLSASTQLIMSCN